jgi:rhamnosyltransferase subunit B
MATGTLIRRPKIVLATFGTYGDLHPFISIALELKAAGYEAVIACSGHYRSKIEAEGLGFHAVRPNELDRQRDLGMDDTALTRQLMTGGIGSLEFVMRKLILPYLRQSYEDMMTATQGASLVVTSSFAFGATLAAQKRALPYINVALQPIMIPSVYDPPSMISFPRLSRLHPRLARKLIGALSAAMHRRIAPWAQPIHDLRHELGLPAAQANPLLEGQLSPYGTIGLYSPLLGAVQPDFAPHTSIAGFAYYDSENGGAQRLEPALERFLRAGPAPLVFTLGSQAVHNAGNFYSESLAAARELRQRAVILVGPGGRSQLPAELPAEIMACSYAPYSLLFPNAAAIIHHGGVGTTAQALRAGRPQLVVPFWGDQPDNAARVARLGVARTLARKHYRAARLRKELAALAGQPSYAARAAQVGRTVARENGAEQTARLIDALLRKGVPAAPHRMRVERAAAAAVQDDLTIVDILP